LHRAILKRGGKNKMIRQIKKEVMILIQTILKEEIERHKNIKITLKTMFYDDLGLDSLHFVELKLKIEEKFHIIIAEQDWAKIKTPGQLIEYLKPRLLD
jgi:acyl carrier protein